MIWAAAFAFLLLPAPRSACATQIEVDGIPIVVGPMGDSAAVVQWRILGSRGIGTPELVRKSARNELRERNALPFDFQRVEFLGMLATDDTEINFPGMFDKKVKLSYLNEIFPKPGFGSAAKYAIAQFLGGLRDLKEAASDTRGEPTKRGRDAVASLHGLRINELFAHSWGTEAVYLGILRGDIIPPRKLFIVGVPEANEQKWLLLAKYTGIEVHVVGFENDIPKHAGDAANTLKSTLPDGPKLEELWRSRCAERGGRGCSDPAKFIRTKFDYNVGIPWPNRNEEGFFEMLLSHSRFVYYGYLAKHNFFNKTIEQMDGPQLDLIMAEESRMLESARREAEVLIAIANERYSATLPVPAVLVAVPVAPRVERAEVVAISPSEFAMTFPDLAQFAIDSCRQPGSGTIPQMLYGGKTYAEFYGSERHYLSWYYAQLDSLTGCPRQLFNDLFNLALSQDYWKVSERGWVERQVSYYTPPKPSSGRVSTPRGDSDDNGGETYTPRPDPVHDPEGEALEQLRDAERRKRWNLPPRR